MNGQLSITQTRRKPSVVTLPIDIDNVNCQNYQAIINDTKVNYLDSRTLNKNY